MAAKYSFQNSYRQSILYKWVMHLLLGEDRKAQVPLGHGLFRYASILTE